MLRLLLAAGLVYWLGSPTAPGADLSFMAPGDCVIEVFCDGINADNHGEDYRHMTIKSGSQDRLEIKMAPGGGWVAKIERAVN